MPIIRCHLKALPKEAVHVEPCFNSTAEKQRRGKTKLGAQQTFQNYI